MDLERNGESQDNISNGGQPRIQKKRKARGTTLMLELTKNWDGNVITVEYDQKGRPTPREVRRKIAGYEGALARVMVPLNAFSDWRKLKDLREGQLERDLWATMKVFMCILCCINWHENITGSRIPFNSFGIDQICVGRKYEGSSYI